MGSIVSVGESKCYSGLGVGKLAGALVAPVERVIDGAVSVKVERGLNAERVEGLDNIEGSTAEPLGPSPLSWAHVLAFPPERVERAYGRLTTLDAEGVGF